MINKSVEIFRDIGTYDKVDDTKVITGNSFSEEDKEPFTFILGSDTDLNSIQMGVS